MEQRLKIEHLLGHKASNWLKDKVITDYYLQHRLFSKTKP